MDYGKRLWKLCDPEWEELIKEAGDSGRVRSGTVREKKTDPPEQEGEGPGRGAVD